MMLEKIKKIFWAIIFFIYSLIFRKKPGPVAMNFMKNLGFVFSGLILSKVFSLLFQVMSGRLLGSVEYGKFALVLSISNIFWTFMYLAIGTAMVKYFASARSEREKMEIMSTGIILLAISTIAFAALFYILSIPLAAVFSVSIPYILAAVILAVGLNIWTLAEKVCQGLNKMKKLGALNVLWTLSMLAVGLALYLYTRTALTAIVAVIVAYIIPSVFVIPDLRGYFRPKLSRKWTRILMKYSLIGIIGTVSFSTVAALNKIFINIFLSMADVGIYQAYQYSTLTVASFFITGFIMVFFPASSMYKNKNVIFSQINRFLRVSPILYTVLLAASAVILMLYGSEYAIIFPLLLLFALAGIVTSVHSLYAWFSASMGIEGVKVCTKTVSIICIINIAAALLLIPGSGLYGAALSIIAAYAIGTVYIYSRLGRLLSKKKVAIERGY